jgi:hypothetical protein
MSVTGRYVRQAVHPSSSLLLSSTLTNDQPASNTINQSTNHQQSATVSINHQPSTTFNR